MAFRLLPCPTMSSSLSSVTAVMTNGHSDRMAAVVNNLANTTTVGFKRSYSQQKCFDDVLGEVIEPSRKLHDFSQGPIRATGNPFDFAIEGQGFFVVEKDGLQYYTRNGQFKQSPDGTLLTASGLRVLGTDGQIVLPPNLNPAQLTTDANGALLANGQPIGTLKIVNFADPSVLRDVGPTTFHAPPETAVPAEFNGTVNNRALEGSNSSVFEEMAELMTTVRSYESCQKMIRAQDEMEAKMVKSYV